jgi:hypothetical protein
VETAKRYSESYKGSPAEEYVKARGLGDLGAAYGLGYVHSVIPGHERYRGSVSIPYLRPAGGEDGVATVRFRCIREECVRAPDGLYYFQRGEKEKHDHKGGKYNSIPGDPPRLYNTAALIDPSPFLVVVEGEFDTLSWQAAEVPAIGAPGTGSWRDYWTPALLGYETVYLIAEDAPGVAFMDALAADIPNAKVIEMADQRDSNQILMTDGPEALRDRIGL